MLSKPGAPLCITPNIVKKQKRSAQFVTLQPQNEQAMQMHNFNSGPSVLPHEVLTQAAESLINFNNTGLSLLEIGHRTTWFGDVLTEAISLIKELMQLQ